MMKNTQPCDTFVIIDFLMVSTSIVQFFIPIGNKLFSFSFSITFFFSFFFFAFPSTNRIDVRDKCSPLTSITIPVILQICFIIKSKHISLNAMYINLSTWLIREIFFSLKKGIQETKSSMV